MQWYPPWWPSCFSNFPPKQYQPSCCHILQAHHIYILVYYWFMLNWHKIVRGGHLAFPIGPKNYTSLYFVIFKGLMKFGEIVLKTHSQDVLNRNKILRGGYLIFFRWLKKQTRLLFIIYKGSAKFGEDILKTFKVTDWTSYKVHTSCITGTDSYLIPSQVT